MEHPHKMAVSKLWTHKRFRDKSSFFKIMKLDRSHQSVKILTGFIADSSYMFNKIQFNIGSIDYDSKQIFSFTIRIVSTRTTLIEIFFPQWCCCNSFDSFFDWKINLILKKRKISFSVWDEMLWLHKNSWLF